jgi:hypothetical protein
MIERSGPRGERVYFTDDDGSRWRLFDGVIVRKRRVLAAPPVPLARTRLFVPSDPSGARREYTFAPTEPRLITDATLIAQLSASEVLPFGRRRADARERLESM